MRGTRHLYLAIGGLMLGVSVGYAQVASDEKAHGFIDLFTTTCVKYYGKGDALRAELQRRGLPRVPPENESFFLRGKDGRAWSATNSIGEYVIALHEDGVCAVFARRAKDTDVQRLFANLVQALPILPMVVKKGEDTTSMTPNGPTHYVTYTYGKPEAKGLLHFGLTTASSETADLQAMATLSMVRNE